jgi:hypothetical protein
MRYLHKVKDVNAHREDVYFRLSACNISQNKQESLIKKVFGVYTKSYCYVDCILISNFQHSTYLYES